MRKISIAELGEFCGRHGIQKFLFESYNQGLSLDYNPMSLSLHFDTLVTISSDGMVVFKDRESLNTMSIVDVFEISVDDSMTDLGITICIKCCSLSNSKRVKTYTFLAS